MIRPFPSVTNASCPGTSTHEPSPARSSSLNVAPGSMVAGESASTFVSTTLPSTGLFEFLADTATVWFGVADVMANSTGSDSMT